MFSASAQSIEGIWNGDLEVVNQKLKLIITLEKNQEDWSGKMDIPQQGAVGIKISKVLFDGMMLFFEINNLNISYEGVFSNEQIIGNFKQNGVNLPLNFLKSSEEPIENIRPQHPSPPFSYELEEVSFLNSNVNISLRGTLTKPKGAGQFPAVVLVGGSGPSDRDNQVLGHRPFYVLADQLTKNGILVLRFDERGVGESEGDFKSATYTDLVQDVKFALEYLSKHPNVNQAKIGVIGHSEGGMIAMQIGAESNIPAFILSLAGPVVPIKDLMVQQTEDVYRSAGMPKEFVDKQVQLNQKVYDIFIKSANLGELDESLQFVIGEFLNGEGLSEPTLSQQKDELVKAYSGAINPWFLELIKLNPELFISQIKVPLFAAFGGKDTQVNAAQNGNRLFEIFKSHPERLSVKVYPELNHLFQNAKTGSVNEYAQIEETIDVQLMKDIVDFILKK